MYGDGKIQNKQISANDILEFSKNIEEYKRDWENIVNDENEKLKYISKYRKYQDFETSTRYKVVKKDGESISRDDDYEWFVNSIKNIEELYEIIVSYSLCFYGDKENNFNRNSARISLSIYPNNGERTTSAVDLDISSDFEDADNTISFDNLKKLGQYYSNAQSMTVEDVIKIVGVIESLKESWKIKNEDDEQKFNSTPNRKRNYSDFTAKIDYSIDWYDGKDKKESSREWFEESMKDYKNIRNVSIYYSMYFRDENNDDQYKRIDATINFYTYSDSCLQSRICYDVSTTNMESEADKLHSRIENFFSDKPVRYDSTIKYRNLRIQAFSTAIGIVLSYIIFLALKFIVNEPGGFFTNLLNNKNVIIFGQWVVAILVGNVIGYPLMNTLYKPLLPSRIYKGYDRSSGKSIYKDDVNEYIEHTEIQIGKYYDLASRRERINKMFKYSLIVILEQLVISGILFLILK